MANEYDELAAEKEALNDEYGIITEGQIRADIEGNEGAMRAGNRRKEEIRARLGEIRRRMDEIAGS